MVERVETCTSEKYTKYDADESDCAMHTVNRESQCEGTSSWLFVRHLVLTTIVLLDFPSIPLYFSFDTSPPS